ncbi:MAG: L,D-transpeptidase [Acidobacteriota bacterium]
MKTLRTIALLLTLCTLAATACNRQASPSVTRTESTTSQIQPASLVSDTSTNSGDVATIKSPVEPTMLQGPNAVPKDTRIVINIPAYRMDVFKDGVLVKSYKVGIGYPEYPLPRGLRKAETIIFNPTWTPPNEPWVANPGVVVPAGSKANPLGPIKVPIGSPSLIHGGKALSKIGTFASHGCVGMTNEQVKDFAKVLADVSGTELSTDTMSSYLKRPSRTQVLKLAQIVPVELRYETIVVEEGKLRIYRDVYGQKTNTEENLRAVLDAHGISFDGMSEPEKLQVLEILNIVSRNRKRQPTPTPTVMPTQTVEEKRAAAAARKAEAERLRKLRSQKEFAIDIGSLTGKGYPAAVNLNDGKPLVATAR